MPRVRVVTEVYLIPVDWIGSPASSATGLSSGVHCAWYEPLACPQLPVTTKPPSTRLVVADGARTEQSRLDWSCPRTSCCACSL
ncbi:hypothetical protein BKE56_010050 [Rhodococcus sp. M8]|nr:hypothetical protein BKE56_010050 [Rhodococcus sp. M8]